MCSPRCTTKKTFTQLCRAVLLLLDDFIGMLFQTELFNLPFCFGDANSTLSVSTHVREKLCVDVRQVEIGFWRLTHTFRLLLQVENIFFLVSKSRHFIWTFAFPQKISNSPSSWQINVSMFDTQCSFERLSRIFTRKKEMNFVVLSPGNFIWTPKNVTEKCICLCSRQIVIINYSMGKEKELRGAFIIVQ